MLHVPLGDGTQELNRIATIQKNFENLGFAMSAELCERLRTLSDEKLDRLYKDLVKILQKMVGAHRQFNPMYPNFPRQVMDMSEAELYLQAILHYITRKIPEREKLPRPNLIQNTRLRVIELGTKDDFEKIFTRLASSKTSLSAEDKQDLRWFVAQYKNDIKRLLPDKNRFQGKSRVGWGRTSVADRFWF